MTVCFIDRRLCQHLMPPGKCTDIKQYSPFPLLMASWMHCWRRSEAWVCVLMTLAINLPDPRCYCILYLLIVATTDVIGYTNSSCFIFCDLQRCLSEWRVRCFSSCYKQWHTATRMVSAIWISSLMYVVEMPVSCAVADWFVFRMVCYCNYRY